MKGMIDFFNTYHVRHTQQSIWLILFAEVVIYTIIFAVNNIILNTVHSSLI